MRASPLTTQIIVASVTQRTRCKGMAFAIDDVALLSWLSGYSLWYLIGCPHRVAADLVA